MRTNKWMETTHVCALSDKRSHHTLVLITTTYEKQQRAGNHTFVHSLIKGFYQTHVIITTKWEPTKGRKSHTFVHSHLSHLCLCLRRKNYKYEVWSREPTKGWKPHTIVHSRTKGALSSFIGFSSILHACKLLTSITSNKQLKCYTNMYLLFKTSKYF